MKSSPSCDPQQIPVSRSKRKVDQSKTSCLLHLHADHRFYKRFGSVEAVVAQVSFQDLVLKRFFQFDIYRQINTILFLLTLKCCSPSVPNLHEVGFTACSFLDPTGDFSEMVGLYVTNGTKPSSLLWL